MLNTYPKFEIPMIGVSDGNVGRRAPLREQCERGEKEEDDEAEADGEEGEESLFEGAADEV